MGNKLRRGTAMIEFCFLLPWYVFLFAGAFDFGFYSYSLIATTTAARAAAYYCAASATTCADNTTTCTNYVTTQLRYLPNVGSAITTCNAAPITVSATYPAAATCPDGNGCASVSVAYVTPQMVPIPGLLPSQLTITKVAVMRLRK